MFHLPSLAYILEKGRAAFKRFPYPLICSFLGGATAILLIENQSDDFWFLKLLMTFGLGISLFFSLTLYLERPLARFRLKPVQWLGAGSLLLLGFYFLSGQAPTENFFLNYAQWALALHLLAAFSPFLGAGEARGFWQFNRYLFLRFLLSALYAGVFFIGMVIALGAVDHLLGIKIHDKLYPDLWVFSVSFLMTWHFLAGVPKGLDKLDRDDSYPGGLKVFTQYLLVPLVTLYLVILYLYLGKILLKADWPKGTVTWLVSVVSVAGVFNLLLLQPVQEKKENGWIRVYARGFYWALLPLLGMLFTAVGKRIGQYGVTEQRYFVTILGLWILGIALYFLFHNRPTIKTVPLTLFLVTLLTSMGPWGAYSVSRMSQMARLKAFFVKDGLWNGTKAVKTAQEVPWEDRQEISSILDYLVENHGVALLQPWFDLDLSKWKDERERHRYGYSSVSNEICKSLGFDHVDRWQAKSQGSNFYFYSEAGNEALSVKDYDYWVQISGARNFKIGGQAVTVTVTGPFLTVKPAGGAELVFDLADMVASLEKDHPNKNGNQLPAEELSMESSNGEWKGKLYLSNLQGSHKDKGIQVSYPQGFLLLRRLR
ncbi:MAG TPA: DUF4153 domain-containing protein [bacterium]|nr:DUF4153 domain-containing protein [bacterium]